MLTQRNFARIIISGFVLTIAFVNQPLQADECASYKESVEYYAQLRREGGNSDEMNRWTAIGHKLEDKLYHCRQDRDINPTIHTTAGETTTPIVAPAIKREPLRSSISDDAHLQRLIETCNYWIKQGNENASQDNINFRNTACRAVDNHENALENPNPPTTTAAVRKLKDCIKPNNLIDHDVNECVKGNIEPTWKK